MKLSISTPMLINVLKQAQAAVSPKSTLPVLACVLLDAHDGLLSVSGTNLEMGITANAPAQVTEPGAICTPAKMLIDLLAAAVGDRITLETVDYKLRVMWAKSKSHLNTMPADEFPPMPAFKYEGQEIAGEQFSLAVKQVAFSASTDEGRPVLQGIQFIKGKLAATDGFRISITRLEGLEVNALIPAGPLNTAARMAKDDKLTVRLENGKMIITGSGWQLTVNQLEGTFPDYNVILPRTNKTTVTVSGKALKAAIAQVRAVGGPVTKLEFNGIQATIDGQSEEGGDTSTEIEAIINGPAQKIAFNTQFLAESIAVLGEKIKLDLNDHKSPCTLHGDDPNFTHVLMPMHVT
jgi:DNA polymerase III subunit beta